MLKCRCRTARVRSFTRTSLSMRPDRRRCSRTSFAGACAIRNSRKAVLYSYFKGAHREPDLNGGATLVLRTEHGSGGWFWYIPLENDITSVGIVADPEYLLKGRGQDLAKIFQEEIEKCEPCRKRVAEGDSRR